MLVFLKISEQIPKSCAWKKKKTGGDKEDNEGIREDKGGIREGYVLVCRMSRTRADVNCLKERE